MRARRPAGACRAWDGARSRSRAAARRCPRRPRRRRAGARTRARRPRRRRRGAAAPRSPSSSAAARAPPGGRVRVPLHPWRAQRTRARPGALPEGASVRFRRGPHSTATRTLPLSHDSSHRHDASSYAGVPRHRRRRAAHGHDPPRGQQERRAHAARGDAAHGRAGRARQHAAHPRRRDDARAARRPGRGGRRGRQRNEVRVCAADVHSTVAGRGALGAHPRVDPARRPAARALRQRRRSAAGR